METNKSFWLSYDLGIKGDYTGLYTFLDSVGAKECGSSIAYFQKDFGDDPLKQLTTAIQNAVRLEKTDRIYVTFIDPTTQKAKGKFLFGRRKRAPWEGYSTIEATVDEDN